MAASVVLGLFMIEGASRIWVAAHWPKAKLRFFTEQSDVKGMYKHHPTLSYTLAPGYDNEDPDRRQSINSLGFRGPEIPADKPPGTIRIATVGGSTTMGSFVADGEEYPQVLAELLRAQGLEVDVVNAGVPNWSSRENLENLELRVLPLRPDLVVFYQGRNDLMPQAYDNFEPDYSHFRKRQPYRETNALPKQLHRISHAFMLFEHHGSSFGLFWDALAEDPLYGSLRYENHPSPEGVTENLRDHERRTAPFRDRVDQMITLTKAAGALPVLATLAFVPDKYASSALHRDDRFLPALAAQMKRNNDVTRALAKARGVVLADTAVVAEHEELFHDDCHMQPAGHRMRAEIIYRNLRSSGALEVLRAHAQADAVKPPPAPPTATAPHVPPAVH